LQFAGFIHSPVKISSFFHVSVIHIHTGDWPYAFIFNLNSQKVKKEMTDFLT